MQCIYGVLPRMQNQVTTNTCAFSSYCVWLVGLCVIVCPVAMPNVEKDRQLDDKHLHSSSAVCAVLHGIVLSCTFCPGATSGRDEQV